MFLKIGIVALILLVIIGVMFVCYKKVPSNKLLVKYGLFVKNRFQIRQGGGAFLIPYFQGIKMIDLGILNTDIQLKEALSLNKIPVNILADATFKVSSNEKEQQIVAETLLGSELKKIQEIAQEVISGELRAVIANLTIDEINTDRELLKEKASANIETALSKIGLDLMNLNLKSIMDTAGVLEQMGLKSASEIKNKAKADVAEQEKFGRTAAANFEAQTIKAEKEAEVNKTEAVLNAQQEMEKKKAETNLNIQLKQTEAEKEANVKNQEAKQAIIEQQTITAKKQADLKLESLRAEELVAKKIENEKEILDNETNLKIQTAKAENELFIANKKAEAITIAAKAEADAIKLKAEANAELIALPKIREAEAVAKLNEALSGQSEEITNYLVQIELIKNMPAILNATAEGMKAIGFKDITIIGGGSSEGAGGTGAIANTLGDITKMFPAMALVTKMMDGFNKKEIVTVTEKES